MFNVQGFWEYIKPLDVEVIIIIQIKSMKVVPNSAVPALKI